MAGGDTTPAPASEPTSEEGKFDVMGGSSVALLGYSVVRVQCKVKGGATVALPRGFKPLSVLPALPGTGTCTYVAPTVEDPVPKLTIASATKDAVFFVIGQA